MALIDIKKIESEAKKQICEEATTVAVQKLKELYLKRDKASLVLANVEREIRMYLEEVSEISVYEAAGVDTTKKS